MKVAIFGAGLAGLATGIGLRSQGHECRIYERSRQAHDAGMGFILMPEAISGLEDLGVQLRADWSGIPLNQYLCRDSRGEILARQALPSGTRSFRRRDLIAAMVAVLNGNEPINFGAELERLEFDEREMVKAAFLSSGPGIRADLYVAADGSRSKARAAMFPDWHERSAPVAEVVGMVRCADAIDWSGENFNKFHADGGGLALGIVPVDRNHVVWFLQFDVQRFHLPGETGEARLAFVEGLVGKWGEPVPHLLAHTDYSRVYLWQPMDADPVPRFSCGNLVLVGDAAHPMLPFTSRGVSSAIADVVELTGVLKSSTNLGQALTAYSTQRRRDCAPYIEKGRELTRKFLSPLRRENMTVPLAI